MCKLKEKKKGKNIKIEKKTGKKQKEKKIFQILRKHYPYT